MGNEGKSCPFKNGSRCTNSVCGIYDEEADRCGVLSIAKSLQQMNRLKKC